MIKWIYVLAFVTCLILIGFVVDSSKIPQSDFKKEAVGFKGYIRHFTTNQGIECIFAKAGYGGGLSCNWNRQ